jgi:hypothetical protein
MSEQTFLLAVIVVFALGVAFLSLMVGLLLLETWRLAREIRTFVTGLHGAGRKAAQGLGALGRTIKDSGSKVGGLVETAAHVAVSKIAERTREKEEE